jgi:AcrR family transcriptional regulator
MRRRGRSLPQSWCIMREKTTAPRKLPTQRRSRDTVNTILDAAARILSRGDDAAIDTNRIAEVAGVSVGSLYQYFPSKSAVLAALIERYVDARFRRVEADLEGLEHLAPEQAIERIVAALIDAKIKNLELERALLRHFVRLGEIEALAALDERMVRVIARFLTRLPGQGDRDSELAAFVVLQAVRAVMQGASVHRPEEIRNGRLERELVALVSGYLLR